MGKKKDLRQIDAIAKEFGMNEAQRREFGVFVEEEKASGYGGSKNERRDFTYEELRQKACEFLDQN